MDLTQEGEAKLDRLLRRFRAAEYITDTYGIPCSPKTLAKYACIGGGLRSGSPVVFRSTPSRASTSGPSARSARWFARRPNCTASPNPTT
jgi:hypothetical protein